jgi:hypothetical protein
MLLAGVHRFLPRVLLKSMALVCFGTSTLSTKTRSTTLGTLLDQRSRFTSGLRRFHSLLSSRVFHTQSSRSVDVCPPTDRRSSAPSALRASGFQISTSLPSLSPRVFFPELHRFLPRILLEIDGLDLLRPSGLRRSGLQDFRLIAAPFSSGVITC